ncbi:MAG: FHA domain-containing protein [Desulfobacterales bacterium]
MPTLTLKFKDKNLKRFRFKQGTTINIGRKEDNHIIIENLAVSSRHARIDSVGKGYLLIDLKSKNGTFVNEKMISTCWLRHGDNITIAKHILVFAYTEDEQQSIAKKSLMGQTMVVDPDTYRKVLSINPNAAETASTPGNNTTGVLVYLQGGTGEITLSKKLFKVGKNPSSDIVIKGLLVGKTSFTINKKEDDYYLSYVSGFLKPRVNREAVKDTVMLNEFDTIDIGTATFQFLKKK